MPTLKETEASMSYVQCFLYLVSSINVSIFHSVGLDTFWTDLVNMVFGQQDNNEGFVVLCSGGRLCSEGSGKKRLTLTFQRCVTVDAKRQ